MTQKTIPISITVLDEYVKKIDGMVDGLNIRNRNHAIVVLINKAFELDEYKNNKKQIINEDENKLGV